MAQDLFGRDAGNVDAKSMMQSLSGKVSQILETKDTNAETALAKVVDAVNRLASKIDPGAKEESNGVERFANSVIQCYQEIFKKSGKEGEKRYKGESVEAKLGRKAIQQIVKMGASPNTFWVGIGHFNQKAISQFKRVLVDCGICGSGAKIVDTLNQTAKKDKTKQATQEVANAGLPDVGDGGAMGGGPGGGGGNFQHVLGGLKNVGLIISGWIAEIGNMFETKLTDSYKGVMIHSNKLRESLREVIFQTQGYSETNRAMEKDFMDLNQATISSGVSAAKFDEQWIKNLKTGFGYMSKAEKGDKSREQILQRQIKTHKSVQTSALNTAATLGMSVDNTNDMFMSWHMQLGMSANQLANMGRSMKQISLSTGVTGVNLENAMKSADAVMKTMRDTGSLTDTAAENVINMSALAQKHGVEDTMAPLLKAMSGGSNLDKADPKTQGLLNSIMYGRGTEGSDGMYWSVKSGDILQDREKMAQGQSNMGNRARMALRASGVANADTMDLSNITKAMKDMTSKQKSLVQNNFENIVRALPGEFERVFRVFEEGKKTQGEKMVDVTKEIALAKARGSGGTDATKALVRKKNEMETGNIQQVFGKISDEMKEGKTLEQAKEAVFKETEGNFGTDYANELIKKDFGGSANKLMSGLQERAKASGKNLNDVLTSKGMSEKNVLAALKNGTKDQRITAAEVLDSAMAEIGQAESANRDPITKINDGIRLTNNYLQRIADSYLFGISDTLLQILFYGTKLASLAGVAIGLLTYMLPMMLGSGLGTKALAAARTLIPAAKTALASAGAAAKTALPSAGGILGRAKGFFGFGGSAGAKSAMDITTAAHAGATATDTVGKSGLLKSALKSPKGKAGMIIAGGALLTYGAYKMFGGGKSEAAPANVGGAGIGVGTSDGITQVHVVNWPDCICGGGDGTGVGGTGTGGKTFNNTVTPPAGITPTPPDEALAEAEEPAGVIDYAFTGLEAALTASTVKGLITPVAAVGTTGAAGTIAKTGIVGTVGKFLGPAFVALEAGLGGIKGYGQAEETGHGKIYSALLGAVTGKATTGTEAGTMSGLVSSSLGLQRGGNADELVGAYGAMAGGAVNGAIIGASVGGVPGALIGAGVGSAVAGTAEVSKVWSEGYVIADRLKDSAEIMTAGYEIRQKQLVDEKSINGGTSELMKLLASKKDSLLGQQKNLDISSKQYSDHSIPEWLDPSTKASRLDMEYDQKILATTQQAISEIESKLKQMNVITGASAVNAPNIPSFDVGTSEIVNSGMGNRARMALRASGVANADTMDLSNITKAMKDMTSKQKGLVQSNFENIVGTLPGEFERVFRVQEGTLLSSPVTNLMEKAQEKSKQEEKDTTGKDDKSLPADKLEKAYEEINQKSLSEASDGIGLGLFDNDNIGGAFEGGVGAMTSEMSQSENEYSELVDAADRLIDALYYASESREQSSGGSLGLGLFDTTNILNAMEDGVNMMVSGVSNTFNYPLKVMKSVADTINAPGQMINNRLTSAFADKSKADKSDSRVADAGKSMYYSDTIENMTQGVGNMVDSLMNTPVGKTIVEAGLKAQASTNLMDYSDDTKAQVSTNLMDYSDDTKGSVATSMFSISDSENRVAQEKYGSMPSGSIPGMSGVEDYLAEEQHMIKIMIEYLAKIERNTSIIKGSSSKNIGPKTNGLPQPEGLKMRRISQEQSSGEWDLTFGDYSPSVTT